jgi:hypothetical protein
MMRKLLRGRFIAAASVILFVFLYSCDKNDDDTTNNTMRSQDYSLVAVDSSGITGKVTISENFDKSFNVLVKLDNSVKDTVHVMHIHNGSIASPGSIAIPLTPITGTGGAVQANTANITSVVFPDSSVHSFTYDSILNFKGYLNVHYSSFKIDSLISQGNIGSSNNN